LTAGNGWAAYPTTEGIIITDKNLREFVISADIYNASDGTGDLTYEIGKCSASVSSDSDDQHFSMNVMGSKLVIGVRGGPSVNARYLEYDFSPGIEASGVEEMLNPETKRSYIWSPPAIYNADALVAGALGSPGAMGSIINASGRLDYISTDDYPGGSTNHGRIERIHTGASGGDNLITTFMSYAISAPFMSSDFMLLVPQRIEATHRCLASAFDSAYLNFATDQTPTFPANQSISCQKASNYTLTTASSFALVRRGDVISGTGITAGTYVATIESTTSLTMSAPATDSLLSSLAFTSNLPRKLKREGVWVSGHTLFQRQIVPIDQMQRAKTDCFWVRWETTRYTSSGTPDRIWRIVLQYSELENVPRQAGEN
jgi:hypothetical protein